MTRTLLDSEGGRVSRLPACVIDDTEIAGDLRRSALRRLGLRREERQDAFRCLRYIWHRAGTFPRALLLDKRARMWEWHPAAMAVERSVGVRLAVLKNGRRLPR